MKTLKAIISLCSLLFLLFLPTKSTAFTYSILSAKSCLEADSLVLVELYEDSNGDNWTDNSGWLEAPLEEWFGVTLDDDGCSVTIIDLHDNNLTGDLINLDLPQLLRLRLNNNHLTSHIPDFNKLPQLLNLDLHNNQLTGSLPDFSNLSLLTDLNLSNNQLVGTLPNFTNFSELEILDLSGNQLVGSIPDFTDLPNLQTLDLGANELTGTIPNFTNLSNLTKLFVSANRLRGNLPDFFNLPNLTHFFASNNELEGNLVDFSNLPNLAHLKLNNNLLTASLLNFLNLPKLQTLTLNGNQLSSTIPNFSNLPLLQELELSSNQLKGNIPNFSNLSILKTLEFFDNQFIFSDILNAWGFISNLSTCTDAPCVRYAPQATIPLLQSDHILSIEVGGNLTDNRYFWYKNGELLPNMPIVGDNSFAVSENGTFHCEVTNDIVTNTAIEEQNLVLKSESIEVILDDIEPSIASTKLLEVFPNPFSSNLEILIPNGLTSKIVTIKIYGLDSRTWKAFNIEVNERRIFLQSSTELPDGIYVVCLLLEDGSYLKSEQLVKERR